MNKTFSKIFLFFITIMMVLQVAMPISVHADDKKDANTQEFDIDVTYHVDDKGNTSLTRGDAYGDKDGQDGVWNKIFTQYKGVIVGITGIGTLTMVCLFIFNFMKLGQSAGNPQARSAALTGLLWTGLAAAGLGGVTIFVGFSTNLLKG